MSGWAKKLKKIFCCCEKEEKPEKKESCEQSSSQDASCSPDKETLLKAYQIQAPGYTGYEQLFTKYILQLLASLVVYGYAVDRYFTLQQKGHGDCACCILVAGTLVTGLIAFGMAWSAVIFAYKMRDVQLVLGKLEERLCLSTVFHWKKPGNYCCICDFLPEINGFVFKSAWILIAAVSLLSFYLLKWCAPTNTQRVCCLNGPWFVVVFGVVILVTSLLLANYYKCKFNRRL